MTPAARVLGGYWDVCVCGGTNSGERDSDWELEPQTTSLLLFEVTASYAFSAVSQVSSQQMACFLFHRQREIRLE